MSNQYLDREGLIELWSKIKSTFATQTQINQLVDSAPSDYNTLGKIANWINSYDGDAIIAGIEGRKSIYLPIQSYGFNTNIRINQTIDGKSLIDEVFLQAKTNNRQVILRCGDYDMQVTSLLEANDYQGFSLINMNLNPTDENPFPALEKGVFLYSVALNKTFSFYEKAYTNTEIDAKIIDTLNATLLPLTVAEIDEICANTTT